jgi:hypothetical protein
MEPVWFVLSFAGAALATSPNLDFFPTPWINVRELQIEKDCIHYRTMVAFPTQWEF